MRVISNAYTPHLMEKTKRKDPVPKRGGLVLRGPDPDSMISFRPNRFTDEEWQEKIKAEAVRTAEHMANTGEYEWDLGVTMLFRDFVSTVSPDRIGIINDGLAKGQTDIFFQTER